MKRTSKIVKIIAKQTFNRKHQLTSANYKVFYSSKVVRTYNHWSPNSEMLNFMKTHKQTLLSKEVENGVYPKTIVYTEFESEVE